MTMTTIDAIETANTAMVRKLIKYLGEPDRDVWTVDNACVTIEEIPRRYGVPRDARAVRYNFLDPDGGWSFDVRAVWRRSDLMQPTTHVVIEDYTSIDEKHLDETRTKREVNEWLRSLPL